MGKCKRSHKRNGKTERMKSITIQKTLSFVVTMIIAFNCGKKSEPPKEEADQPYSHYMLTDYGSYVEIPHDPALNPNQRNDIGRMGTA